MGINVAIVGGVVAIVGVVIVGGVVFILLVSTFGDILKLKSKKGNSKRVNFDFICFLV